MELQALLLHRNIPLPVIVMTGQGDVHSAVRAMKAGAVDFIEKPYNDDVLLNAIEAAFSKAFALTSAVNPQRRRNGSLNSRRVNVRFSLPWWQAVPTRSSPSISASAFAPWRFIARA